jgi:hypothetical protein
MSARSQIVCGGGWKGTRIERVKVKAWISLFAAVGLGCISLVGAESVWFYACIPGGLGLLISVVLFIREGPREFEFPGDPAGGDLRNLYSACGTPRHMVGPQNSETVAASKGGAEEGRRRAEI